MYFRLLTLFLGSVYNGDGSHGGHGGVGGVVGGVASVESDFDSQKQLGKIKLYPQKRISTIDSPTLREIANQNSKRFRAEECKYTHQ